MSEKNPKLFISYSWTNDEHQQWVLDLATELRENGVDVNLDKWDLKEGHDSYAFMEKMVTDPEVKKVIIVCDEEYAEKADNREGGVGTETQIITPELYSKQKQVKFVAVVKERDETGEAYLPTFYKSRIYIDLSTEENYANNFEQLLRWIYDQPINKKPEIGKKPAYLSDETHIQLGTSSKFRRVINSIKNGKSYWPGALSELYEDFAENLEKFRIETNEGEIDELVIKNIEEFIPYRNDLIQLFNVLSKYRKTDEQAFELTHGFFEKILRYTERPKEIQQYREWDFDNFKFIVHELFLYLNACLIKNQAFKYANYILKNRYYFESPNGINDLHHFRDFRSYLKSMEYRNKRLKANRISIHADLLNKRSDGSGISYNKLMETDFILYMRSCLDQLKNGIRYPWWPETLVYASRRHRAFELFKRSKSKSFFEEFRIVLGLESKEELNELMDAFQKGTLRIPSFDHWPLEIQTLSNASEIATID